MRHCETEMLLLSASAMHFTSSLRLWFLPCWCRVVQWHVLCCKSQSTSKHLETGTKWVNIEITCRMPFIHFWFIWILVNICYEAARSPPKSCNKNMQQRLAMLVFWNGQIDGHCFWSTRDQLHVRSFEASTKTVFRAGNLDRTVREELKRSRRKKDTETTRTEFIQSLHATPKITKGCENTLHLRISFTLTM